MKGPKKPKEIYGYMITFYQCRYCGKVFLAEGIKRHTPGCFGQHRKKVRKTYSQRAKRNYMEGKILNHNRRPKTRNDQKETETNNKD